MKEQIKNILGYLGAILMVASIVFLGVEIINRARSDVDLSKTRSITMSADAKVTAKPDLATLSFAVVTQGKEADKVQTDNDARMKTVIDYLKSSGIAEDDIETSGYNLYPQYDYSKVQVSPPPITGYTANQNVTAKIRNLGSVPAILGGLTSKGVNQINNVAFTIEDPDKVREEARNMAIEKAKTKANDLASKLGVRLGKVINFSEGGGGMPIPIFYDKQFATEGRGGASPVQPGTEDVTVSVTLTFELR